jgi:sulfur carrier protein
MEPETITCVINGIEQVLPEGSTLAAFLDKKGIPHGAVVVEKNREILPKGGYEAVLIANGDTIEIIQIIGGG